MHNANVVAIAGGAISVALVNHLIAIGILNAEAAKGIFAEATKSIQPFAENDPDALQAIRLVANLYAVATQTG